MDRGYIRWYRMVQDSPLYPHGRAFTQYEAWQDLCLEAQGGVEPKRVSFGNTVLEQNRGEVLRSLDSWARRWGWTKSKTRRFLTMLKNRNDIRYANETVTVRITIVKYEDYNPIRNANETQTKRKRNGRETVATPTELKELRELKEREDKSSLYCGAPTEVSTPPLTVRGLPLVYPCVGPKSTWQVSKSDFDRWQAMYPHLDIGDQLVKALDWCITNPSQQKTAKGMPAFVARWLSKATNFNRGQRTAPHSPESRILQMSAVEIEQALNTGAITQEDIDAASR